MGPSVQTLIGPDYKIGQDLGKRADNNLFHSFRDFNINTGESATFTGESSIDRIISRVTDGNVSTIDGALISAIPNADFYFTNPAGFLFAPMPFKVSTADYLKFDNNETFYSQPLDNEVLSTKASDAYGFLDADIGTITFQGSELTIKENESLTVIGGNTEVKGSTLKVSQGDFDLIIFN